MWLPVSRMPGSLWKMYITPRKFAKNDDGSRTSLVGPGGVVWWKKQTSKISCYCPFKFPYRNIGLDTWGENRSGNTASQLNGTVARDFTIQVLSSMNGPPGQILNPQIFLEFDHDFSEILFIVLRSRVIVPRLPAPAPEPWLFSWPRSRLWLLHLLQFLKLILTVGTLLFNKPLHMVSQK